MDTKQLKTIIFDKMRFLPFWWYLKQLFPFTYHTIYKQTDNRKYICIWNMWFGKCFNIEEYELKE